VIALASVIVALLALGATAGVILLYGAGQVEKIEIPQLTEPGDADGDGEVEDEELGDVLNILVTGSDSREGLTPDQLQVIGTDEENGLRTDTIMLVSLDPRRDKVAVLSFPRDLLVTRCDGSRGRINAAYGVGERTGVGGPTCLVDTVQEFSGVPVNHFAQVNFAGFITAVDALGGVTLYLEEPIQDDRAGLDLPAGCVTMDGRTALGFVRVRHIDSDFGRIARQQRFIRELVREAASVGTLVNAPRLLSLVTSVGSSVETDSGMTLALMQRIAWSLRDLTPDRVDTRTVPAVPRTIDGIHFVVPREEEAEQLFQAFRDGTIFPEGLGAGPTELTPADVPPVAVLNGAGIAGFAAGAAQVLTASGFTVSATGNADRYDVAASHVVHPPDRLAEAESLAAAFGGVALTPGDPGSELTLVVGQDFDPGAFPEVFGADEPPTPDPGVPSPQPTEPTFVGATPSGVEC
jgi:LCP family protein required for cell wall assembly